MPIIVNDDGFKLEGDVPEALQLKHLQRSDTGGHTVTVPSDTDVETLKDFLNQTVTVRIEFPTFADGRGFSLARRLRLMGYKGRIRAAGHVLADQYANARRSGFDEVEISEELASRQPEAQWLAHTNWADHDYQSRLRRAS